MITKIIHMSSATERTHLVERIVKLTGAEIFEAIVVEGNGRSGCRQSHETIYKTIKEGESLLLFEDDCVINDESFLNFIEENKNDYDLIYLGVNHVFLDKDNKPNRSFGTHSMWVSYNALQIYLTHQTSITEVDNIWNQVEQKYNLKVLRAKPINKYTVQCQGLKSYITGRPRGKVNPISW
uniref:Glycosyl transferase family 25 domain-containing protein n=1 Tax=viral metagenome TaxID=1070528 RepID=A0A6C0DJI3_9ZZZZ